MMLNNAITFRTAALILLVFVLGACASQGGPVIRPQGDLTKIEKVAVLPYENMTTIHGEGATIRSPITGRVFVTGPVANRADQFLTEQVVSRVRQDIAFKTVPARNADRILNAVADGKGRAWNRRMQLAETGRQLGADAVMVGHVYRFRERVGTNLSAESPASVAFDLYIIDCRRENVVWSAFYNYTQQALSDNLGGMGNFIRRGGRWVTAEQLATFAIEDMFADLPRN